MEYKKCPKSLSNKDRFPKRTRRMIESDQYYVWMDGGVNCWIPTPKDKIPKNSLYIASNIAHVPLPPDKNQYIEKVDEKAGKILSKKEKLLIKALKSKKDIISADDPLKHKFVKEFLKSKGDRVFLYGGTAINMSLPSKYKIYGKNELPDYDVYSEDPFNLAVELSEFLYSKGYVYTEVKSGVHPGTYKVFSNMWPVLDATYVPPIVFDKVKKKKIDGLYVSNSDFLIKNMEREIADTFNNPDRWGKVAYREKVLQYAKPTKMKNIEKHLFKDPYEGVTDSTRHLLKIAKIYGKHNKAIFYGPYAYNKYIVEGGGHLFAKCDHHSFLLENADEHAKILRNKLSELVDRDVTIEVDYMPYKDFNNTNYIIYIGSIPFVIITELEACTPRLHKGVYIGSIDYMKYELYFEAVFGSEYSKAAVIYLTNVQLEYYKRKNIDEFSKSMFQRFIPDCIGPLKNTVKHVMFSRMISSIESRKNIRVIKPHKDTITITGVKGTKIRIYPKSEISETCRDKNKENCGYTCFWNKEEDKCYDEPNGQYKPGVKDLIEIKPNENGEYVYKLETIEIPYNEEEIDVGTDIIDEFLLKEDLQREHDIVEEEENIE